MYLFLGKVLPIVGAAGGGDVIKGFLETGHIVLYKGNAEGDRLVRRSSTLMNKSCWRIQPARANEHS